MLTSTLLKVREESLSIQSKASIYGTIRVKEYPHGTMMAMITFYSLNKESNKFLLCRQT